MPNTTVVTTKRFNLNVSDWVRGLIVAVVTGPITILLDSLNAGSLTFDWKKIGTVALAAGLSYILKNWLMTPNEITIKNPSTEQVQSVKDGDATAKVVQK
jgi:hypothetical protein